MRRTALYHQVQDLLTTEAPAWWVWYDTGWSAVADRVRGSNGQPIDPTRPRYEQDIRDWTLDAGTRARPRRAIAPRVTDARRSVRGALDERVRRALTVLIEPLL